MARNEPRDRSTRPRGLMTFLSVAVILGMVALGLSVINALALGRESDQREAERVTTDLASCERGNVLRGQVVAIGEANEDLVDGVLDVVLSFVGSRETVDRITEGLAPVFDQHRAALEVIELTDCQRVTPGAASTPRPGENP